MLDGLTARVGITAAKTTMIVASIAFALAMGGLGFWRGMARLDAMIASAADRARASAIAERDASWKVEIEKSNAAVERQRAERAIAAAAADAAARAEIDRLKSDLAELEKRNAQLPHGGDRALGRDRVRLLNTRP